MRPFLLLIAVLAAVLALPSLAEDKPKEPKEYKLDDKQSLELRTIERDMQASIARLRQLDQEFSMAKMNFQAVQVRFSEWLKNTKNSHKCEKCELDSEKLKLILKK